jgi:hypothetical protein
MYHLTQAEAMAQIWQGYNSPQLWPWLPEQDSGRMKSGHY